MWQVYISKDKNPSYIGLFKSERHAAIAYDLWARDIYGKYAKLNFNLNKL